MAYRSDRDGNSLIGNVNFEFENQMRPPSADSIRASRLAACTNRPDIRLHPYLTAACKKSPCSPGGVHIRDSLMIGLSIAQAGDKPVLTYKKIEYIAQHCASSAGFSAWLRSKPGITNVDESTTLLTSPPPKIICSLR